jgi:hypothetical protein
MIDMKTLQIPCAEDFSGIKVGGFVSARQGKRILFEDIPNKFTTLGLKHFISTWNWGGVYSGSPNGTYSFTYYGPAYTWQMYLGTDTTTPTALAATALTTPIGTTPGTAVSSKSISCSDGSSNGIWDVVYTGVWNSGTVTGTVGEMALYLSQGWQTTTANWRYTCNANSTVSDPGRGMNSRLAVADSEFTAFTIDNSKALTIDWKIRFQYS